MKSIAFMRFFRFLSYYTIFLDSSHLSSCGARLCVHSYRGAIVDRGASLRSLLLTL
ncbi:MAG: hypothetical protein IKL44_03450 [Clostridia bacterium]|nr:hypothetical protein [Clostridia bacterium]